MEAGVNCRARGPVGTTLGPALRRAGLLAGAALCAWALAVPGVAGQTVAPSAITAASAPTPEPAWVDGQKWADEVREAYAWGDFAALERLFAQASVPGARARDGTALLSVYRRGLAEVEGAKRVRREDYLLQLQKLTQLWLRERSDSQLAHGLHARVLLSRAWAARGNGYADSVPPGAWRDFRRLLQEAADHLARHRDVAMKGSFSHTTLLGIGLGLGWSPDVIWRITQEAAAQNPDDDDLYFGALQSFLPKWGGNAVELDRYIGEVTALTQARRGQELYALLYSEAADDEFKHALFERSAASWPRMRQGLRERLTRFPASAKLRNRFAYLACLAKDRETYLDLAESVGDKPLLDEWGTNPARMWADCRRWAAQG